MVKELITNLTYMIGIFLNTTIHHKFAMYISNVTYGLKGSTVHGYTPKLRDLY